MCRAKVASEVGGLETLVSQTYGGNRDKHHEDQTDQTERGNEGEPLGGAELRILSVISNLRLPHRNVGGRHLLQLHWLERLHNSVRKLDRNRCPDAYYSNGVGV